jgi:DNA-binding Lrp family transcriptional regulator
VSCPLPEAAVALLLNHHQRDFPLVPRPFATLGESLGGSEDEVLKALAQLREQGVVSRVGPVFAPGRAGASTLAALVVPPADLSRVAALVSAFPEVNHNYAREHRYNLWFVVTASAPERLREVLQDIRVQTCLPMLDLPLLEAFHIDLGFDLADPPTCRQVQGDDVPVAPDVLEESQRALLGALQAGLPLVSRPYAVIARAAGWRETEVLAQIEGWLMDGLIKRFGVIVRHHELGFAANAMVVWDIADDDVAEAGRALAALPWVTLCYRRPRRLPDWPYNLFCMIHGRDRATVLGQVAEAAARCGLRAAERAVLFSTQRFKQRGARYQAEATAHE